MGDGCRNMLKNAAWGGHRGGQEHPQEAEVQLPMGTAAEAPRGRGRVGMQRCLGGKSKNQELAGTEAVRKGAEGMKGRGCCPDGGQ